MNPRIFSAKPLEQGFSIIEVLVAVLILGIGLLGAAALQLLSLQNINNAELRTQASLYAQELTELARTAGSPNSFAVSSGSTDSCPNSPGELKNWCEAMGHVLPGSTFVSVWSGSSRDFSATITWPERMMFVDATEDSGAGEDTSSYTLTTRFPQ